MSRKYRPTSSQRRQGQRPPAKVPWWNRPFVWVGGVLSALAIGTAGTFGSGLGKSLAPKVGLTHASTSAPASGYKYCATVIAASSIVATACSDQHANDNAFLPAGFSPAAGTVPLITIYQHDNYRGAALTFYDTHQQCNYGGYRLSDTLPVDDFSGDWGASSWRAYSSCWRTTLYYGPDQTGNSYTYPQGVWEAAYIGSGLGSHIGSVWVRY